MLEESGLLLESGTYEGMCVSSTEGIFSKAEMKGGVLFKSDGIAMLS